MKSLRAGFTLLEMVLVLLIMGIIFTMVIPSIGSMGQDPEEGQPWKELAELLRSSQKMALERAVTVRMVLDPQTGVYHVDSIGATGSGPVYDGTLALGMNMTVEADSIRARFSFRPDGSAYSDSLIVRSSGHATKLHLDPYTGEVLIEER
jgi:prepilin-type N-terminal cleavage/methylation domain-containing protein